MNNITDLLKIKHDSIPRLANQNGSTGEVEFFANNRNYTPRSKGENLKILMLALKEDNTKIKKVVLMVFIYLMESTLILHVKNLSEKIYQT